MATRKETLTSVVDGYLTGNYKVVKKRTVPLPQDIPLGKEAAELQATALFMDLRQSSDITNHFRRQTAAKMFKSYFHGAVSIVRANHGAVRSFNGDGMLALFIDDFRSSNASKAAMETVWFVRSVLRPKFARYFENNRKAIGADLDFSVACGLDEGYIYAVRVGFRGTNDVAWVGRCTNTAAKLSNMLDGQRIGATAQVYSRLHKSRKTSTTGKHMWSDRKTGTFGGETRTYRTSSWGWVIS